MNIKRQGTINIPNPKPDQQVHWLYREENHRKLWLALYAVLALSLLPEIFMHHHPHFETQGIVVDSKPVFFAWYGFVTCALMVVGAKLLAFFLKRPDDYYLESNTDHSANQNSKAQVISSNGDTNKAPSGSAVQGSLATGELQ